MPKLTVKATQCDVHIQDPFPAEGSLVIKVVPGTTTSTNVSWSQLQRLRPQLTQLEVAGYITQTIESTGLDTRADESDLLGLPSITSLDTATTPLAAGGAVTGAQILGTNLLAEQVKASVSLGGGAMSLTAVVPGAAGNDISIEFVDGIGESVAVVGNAITVTLNTGTSTYASVKTTLNTDATVATMVVAGGVSVAVAPITAEIFLVNGVGDGMTVYLGGIPGVFTATTDTACSYDIDLTTLTAGDIAMFEFRSGAKLTQIGIVLL